jgi:hypothetical protein
MDNKPKKYDDDDGRVICNMQVEGLRRHDKKSHWAQNETRKVAQGEQMTRSEIRRYNWYSILAGLLIVSVFSVTWVLFILFCTEVWFR